MGNAKSKLKRGDKSNNAAKSSNFISENDCEQSMDYETWLSEVRRYRAAHKSNISDPSQTIDDYQLFIEYLTFARSIEGSSFHGAITRIIRLYVGSVHGASIFGHDTFTFNGARISTALHPITGEIYIADETQIYHFTAGDDQKQQFTVIAKLPSSSLLTKRKKKQKNIDHRFISDLAFSPNGKHLFCMMDNLMDDVYYVAINENAQNIKVDERVMSHIVHDKMQGDEPYCPRLRYDFSHCYFDHSFLHRVMDGTRNGTPDRYVGYDRYGRPHHPRPHPVHSTVSDSSCLYTLDGYREQLWIVSNQLEFGPFVDVYCGSYSILYRRIRSDMPPDELRQPLLARIPFAFSTMLQETKKLRKRKNEIEQIMVNQRNEAVQSKTENPVDFTQELKDLEHRMQELSQQMMVEENQCEAVDLNALLGFELLNRDVSKPPIRIRAFDVDKLHGGVYLITSDKRFFRIAKQKKAIQDISPLKRKEPWFWTADGDGFYRKYLHCHQEKWCVTHEARLKDVLPDGMPLGYCTIRYDSVSGRIVVADNYKIQALYV